MKKFDIVLIVIIAVQLFFWFKAESQAIDVKEEFFKPSIHLKNTTKINLQVNNSEINFSKHKSIGWGIMLPNGNPYPLKKNSMEQFLVRLFSYRAGPIKGSDEALANELQVGNFQPFARITLETVTGENKKIVIAPGPHNSDYVRIMGEKKIYQLEPTIRWWLSSDENSWISSKLCQVTWPVQNFTWQVGGSETRKITTDGRDWRLRDTKLDKNKVAAFLKFLKNMPITSALGTVTKDRPSFPTSLTLNSSKKEGQSITFKMAPKIIGSQEGFQIQVDDDPRLVFVENEMLKKLLWFDGSPRLFLPDK